jgi:hypothetical protein
VALSDYDEKAFTDLVSCGNTEIDAMVWLTRAQFIANANGATVLLVLSGRRTRSVIK